MAGERLECLRCGEDFESMEDLMYVRTSSDTSVGYCPNCGLGSASYIRVIRR